MGVTHALEHNAVFVERMGREINTHQVALLVEPFQVAPFFHLSGNGGGGNLHAAHVAEERVVHLLLFLLVEPAVAKQGIDKHLAFVVQSEILFAANAKTVESAAEHHALDGLTVAG